MTEDELFFGTSGPRTARIVIVGEAWGQDEETAKAPFVGGAGRILDQMLSDAGIDRADCLVTNVIAKKPQGNQFWRFLEPRESAKGKDKLYGLNASEALALEHGRLMRQIDRVKPDVILACGNYAFWAFSDEVRIRYKSSDLEGNKLDGGGRLLPSGIMDFRGSMLRTRDILGSTYRLLPVLHPAGIMRDWASRHLFVHDCRFRVPLALADKWDPPEKTIISRPSLHTALAYFEALFYELGFRVTEVSNDVETRRGMITCMSFSTEPNFALVVPFLDKRGSELFSYWASPADEARVRRAMRRCFTHRNFRAVGQNYNYDRAYIEEEFGCVPKLGFDTMLAQHLLFPGTEKGLGFLSSMYRTHHRYWKDDNKDWADDMRISADQHYIYNGDDAINTLECAGVLRMLIARQGLTEAYQERLRIQDWCYRTTAKGLRADLRHRNRLYVKLQEAAEARHWFLYKLFDEGQIFAILCNRDPAKKRKPTRTPWYSSPQKLALVLYDILDLPPQYDKKTKSITTSSAALETLGPQFPQFKLLFKLIEDMRSIQVYKSTFLEAVPEPNERYRTFLDPTGAGTFRFSSYENPFNRGLNLQNIPGD
jgi:uracil-DNA glycosylase